MLCKSADSAPFFFFFRQMYIIKYLPSPDTLADKDTTPATNDRIRDHMPRDARSLPGCSGVRDASCSVDRHKHHPRVCVDCPGHPRLRVPLGRLTCDRVCTTGNRVHAWPQRRPTLGPTTCLSLCSLRASYTHGDGRQTLRRRQPLWSRRCSEVQAEAVKSRRDHTADE